MKDNYVDIDTTDFNQDAVKEFVENENIIKKLLRIPNKRITAEERDELSYRVWNRTNIVRRFRKK